MMPKQLCHHFFTAIIHSTHMRKKINENAIIYIKKIIVYSYVILIVICQWTKGYNCVWSILNYLLLYAFTLQHHCWMHFCIHNIKCTSKQTATFIQVESYLITPSKSNIIARHVHNLTYFLFDNLIATVDQMNGQTKKYHRMTISNRDNKCWNRKEQIEGT